MFAVRQLLLRSLLWQFGWRSGVEALLWSAKRARHSDATIARPLAFLALVAGMGTLSELVLLSYAWWLLAGRGPGLRLLLCDLGGPPQRPRGLRWPGVDD
jgi:hypothetical protein